MDRFQKAASLGLGLGAVAGMMWWKTKSPYYSAVPKLMDEYSIMLLGQKLSRMCVNGMAYWIVIGMIFYTSLT